MPVMLLRMAKTMGDSKLPPDGRARVKWDRDIPIAENVVVQKLVVMGCS